MADAAAIQCHLDHSLFDLWLPPRLMILQEKDPPLAVRISAPLALLAIRLLPIFHDLTASTLRALHCDNRHKPSSFRRLIVKPILPLSTIFVHYPTDRSLCSEGHRIWLITALISG
jgi:hypothetical protein